MKTSPTVSIIVPCYNQSRYLAEALDSVLAQTYSEWECIIINDGSTDDTEKVATEYVNRDQRFKYVYQENQGVIAARNNAIRQSQGKYILPLDGDDRISPTYLEMAVPVFESEEEIKIVHGDVELFGVSSGIYKLEPYTMATQLVTNCFSNSSLYRRVDFDSVGGYNPNMAAGLEDWDFWISILENGGKVHKLSSIGHIYRVSSQSRSIDAAQKSQELRSQIWKNHIELCQREFLNLWIFNQDIIGSRLYKVFNWLRLVKKAFV